MTNNTTLTVAAVLAAVPVRDAEASVAFYEQLFGTPPSDSPMPGLTEWDLGGGILQLVVDLERAGGGLITLVLDDLETAAEAIRGRDIRVDIAEGEVVNAVAQVMDPDGNAITLVQA